MEPDKHTPQQILDPSTIENLETARAALRWALERLRSTEEKVGELDRALEEERRARAKTLDDQAALQRSLALRSSDADQRELYYARLEEFLSLKLEGKIDLAALAKRELEAQQLQELVRQKQVHLEKDFAIRRGALERDYQALKQELQEDLRARTRQLEQQSEAKRAGFEREHLTRMADVHEKEAQLKMERGALEERQAHFNEYYEARRAELASQLKNAQAEIEDQARFKIETAERLLTERLTSIEAAWTQEKALLTRELESWRARSRESAPRVVELERALAESETGMLQLRAAHDRASVAFEAERAIWKAERDALTVEAAGWRERAAGQVNEILALKEAAAAADEEARHARAATEQQKALYEQAKTGLESERAYALELAKALAVSEEALSQAHQQKACLDADLAESRARAQECFARLAALEKSLAAADENEAAASRQAQRFDEERAAWQRERDALSSELSAERRKSAEQLARLLEAEKSLAVAQEAEKLVEAAGARQAARFDEQRKAWEMERNELLSWRPPNDRPRGL